MSNELIIKIYCPDNINKKIEEESLLSSLRLLNKDFIGGNVTLEARIVEDNHTTPLFKRLKKLADDIEECEEYNRIMTQLGKWDDYLGNWEDGAYPLRMNVGLFMERTYEVVEEEWGLNKKEICSRRQYSPIPSIRGGIQYLLNQNFLGLSTTKIGQITKRKNHSSSSLIIKRLKRELPVKHPQLIEFHLPRIVNYLEKKNKKESLYF